MTKIGIILGSTRPGRNGEAVAKWVYEIATQRTDAEYELVDLLDYKLPHLDEACRRRMGQYTQPHTQAWAAKIASFDGFVMVTPEYNHSTSGALKNAIDFLFAEWNNKAVGFVSYGSVGGARAVEHLRLIAGELHDGRRARPGDALAGPPTSRTSAPSSPATSTQSRSHTTLDQVVAWSKALAPLRAS